MKTIEEVAQALGADLDGDGDGVIERLQPLQRAAGGDLTFLLDGRPPPPIEEIHAAAVIVRRDVDRDSFPAGTALLRMDNAYLGFACAIDLLYPEDDPSFSGIHPTADIHESVEIGDDVRIAPHVVVRSGAIIGPRTVVHAGVSIGEGVEIGADCLLHPRVTIYPRSEIGRRVVIHSGTVIGSDGFGFVPTKTGIRKIRHLGRVLIRDDVEIGANCTLDRGVLDDTVVGTGTKIDNLVQIGHNVRIGSNCLIAGQAGMAGSCEIGNGVLIAGQVGLGGHLKVGDGAQIGAKSGVHSDIAPGRKVLGVPATDIQTARRAFAVLYRLPELRKEMDRLARRLEDLLPGEA